MSKESFARGFVKKAIDYGVNPMALAGFAADGHNTRSPYGTDPRWPTVGISHPPPSVGDVLSAIGVAQARDVGTPGERMDAFGRIIGSGLEVTTPAGNALRMIGGGALGRAVTGAFTQNSLAKGIGTALGAVAAIRKW